MQGRGSHAAIAEVLERAQKGSEEVLEGVGMDWAGC